MQAAALRKFLEPFIVLLFTALFSVPLKAQQDSICINRPPAKVFAARVMAGSILIHTAYIANISGAKPRAAEFEISRQLTDSATWRKYYCYPRSGLIISIVDLDTRILGKAYSASYFIEPNYRLGNNAAWFIKGGAGLSYLTNPFDSLKNPENHTYSLPINFLLRVGAGISYNLSSKISVEGMISLEHNSNGDFAQPNRGINWYAASVALQYHPNGNTLPRYKIQTAKTLKPGKPVIEAGIFYSPKAGYNSRTIRQRKMLTGATVQITRQVSILNAVSLSAEIYYDGAMRSTKQLFNDGSSSTLAGVMIGHAFVFRHIIFSQQLGAYIYKRTENLGVVNSAPVPLLYHRWGLLYKLNQHVFAGFSFLAHKQNADFVDARLMYRF